nr:hypothetical protein EUGRSUZ_F03068 [Ipomoea batatas]
MSFPFNSSSSDVIWGWRFKSGFLALLIQLSIEPLNELLGVHIHLGVHLRLGILQREGRIRHSQLPHIRGPPEPRQPRQRRRPINRLGAVIQHLKNPLENLGVDLVFAAVVSALVGGGAVAAAELVVRLAGGEFASL